MTDRTDTDALPPPSTPHGRPAMSEHWGPYVTIICIVLAVLYVANEAENRGAELAKACMQAGGTPAMQGVQFMACHKPRTPEADR